MLFAFSDKYRNTSCCVCKHLQIETITFPVSFSHYWNSWLLYVQSNIQRLRSRSSRSLSSLFIYIKYNSNCLNAAHSAFSFFFFRSSPGPTRCVIRARVYKIPIRLKKQFTNARLDRSVDREVFIDENAYRGHFNFQLTDRLVVVISMCVWSRCVELIFHTYSTYTRVT